MRKILFLSFMALVLVAGSGQAADKLKFATASKFDNFFNLLMWAAEEKGYWRENGLEVEWIPFAGGGAMYQAVAAGSVAIGLTGSASLIQASAAGIPVLVVAELGGDEYFFWVSPQSGIKEPKDLKGARIGIARTGGMVHAYGRVAARALGLEKEIKFVAGGGVSEEIAAIRTGKLDGRVSSVATMAKAMAAGTVKKFISVHNYFPKEWSDFVLFARRDFSQDKPALTKRGSTTMIQSANFLLDNPTWAIDKLRANLDIPLEAAREVYQGLRYSRDGKIDQNAIENVRKFLIEYGIVPEGKAPSLDNLYTREFTG